jgi:hypothetical protein
MDIVSHGLWGGLALGRRSRRLFFTSFFLSVLPDILAEGVMFSLVLLNVPGMPSLDHGHPKISEFPQYAQNFYNCTHSLVIFLAVFLVVWIVRKKPFTLLFTWALHILIDIPTHSLELFPTPFLWPISDVKFNGINWREPIIMIPNIILLLLCGSLWFLHSKRHKTL